MESKRINDIYQRKSQVLSEFSNLRRGLSDSEMSIDDKFITGSLLKNAKKVMDNITATTSSDVAPFVNQVWPLIEGWYPFFPLKDLISVQPLEQPLGYIMFSKLLAGTNQAPTRAGDVVSTPSGERVIKGTYPTGEVIGEVITDITTETDAFKALLGFYPLSIGVTTGDLQKIKITIGTNVYVPLTIIGNTVSLALSGTTSASGITLDVTTGLITVPKTTEATVTQITASYVRNIEYATKTDLPKVKEFITNIPIEAKPRALGHEWSVYAEFLKKTQFGKDIAKDNLNRLFELMYQYQCRYVLDEMYEYATGNSGTPVAITLPTGTVSLDNYVQKLKEALAPVSSIIERANGRVEGNRIVTGRNLKNVLESLDDRFFKLNSLSNDTGYNAPRELGQFGKYKVFYDPDLADNAAFMSYKGKEYYDAPYIIGEYMPVTPTAIVPDGVTLNETFCSMEAYKYMLPEAVVRMTIS